MKQVTFKVNEKGRDFVIGDLHGSHSLLQLALDHVRFDPSIDRLFSVGDLIDRGPDSLKCLQLLDEPWFFAVKGNHEDMMVSGMRDIGFQNWMYNGGMWYTDVEQEVRTYELILDELPLAMTVELPEDKKFHVIHAELDHDRPISDAEFANDLPYLAHNDLILWGRYIFRSLYNQVLTERDIRKWRTGAELEKVGVWCNSENLSTIYCGHSVMCAPTKVGKLTNLDTGAVFSYKEPAKYGLTITEPLTNRFWTTNIDGTKEVTPVVVL